MLQRREFLLFEHGQMRERRLRRARTERRLLARR